MKKIRKKSFWYYWKRHLGCMALLWILIVYLVLQVVYLSLFSKLEHKSTVNFYEGMETIQYLLKDRTMEQNEAEILITLKQMSASGRTGWSSDLLGGHYELLPIRLDGLLKYLLTIPSAGRSGSDYFIGGDGKDWGYILNEDGDVVYDTLQGDQMAYLLFNPMPNDEERISTSYSVVTYYLGKYRTLCCEKTKLKTLVEDLKELGLNALREYQENNPDAPNRKPVIRLEEYFQKDGRFFPYKYSIILEDADRSVGHWNDRLPDIIAGIYQVDQKYLEGLEGYTLEKIDRENTKVLEQYLNINYDFSFSYSIDGWVPDESFQREAFEAIRAIRSSNQRQDNGDAWSEGNPFLYFLNGKMVLARTAYVEDAAGKTYQICTYKTITGLLRGNIDHFVFHASFLFVMLFLLSLATAYVHYSKNKHIFMTQAYRNILMDSMAHDLKSPLMTIGGYAENLTMHVHDEKREHYATEIQKSVNYMNEIVMKNLEILKYADEKKRVVRANTNLRSLFEEAFEKYASEMQDRKLVLTMDGSLMARGDEELLKKVAENLVTNAIHYTPDGGTIKVTFEKRRFLVENQTEIEYQGSLKGLWEPFVRGEDSRTGRGTGLGLSIVANVLDKHSWKYRLSYDKDKKIFLCRVDIPYGIIF